jgi:type IX secretion system PorP/SprF family membrane protein
MKRVVLNFLLLLGCIGSVYSQFDAQLSQYMFHNSSFNPAAVGENDMIQTTLQLRVPWLGMTNAGRITALSINTPLKISNKLHGAGIRFLNDRVGQFANQSIHGQYAYKKKISTGGVLSFGGDIGFTSIRFNGDSVRAHPIPIGDYHDLSGDPEIPQTAVAGTSFDLNVGAFYSTSQMYVGLSYWHLNSPVIYWGERTEFRPQGTLFLTGGYSWALPDSKYVLKPTTLLKTDFSSMQWDLSARMEYDNKYWGGLSCRIQDAVVIFGGINIAGGLSIGYSYDLPTTEIINATSGSHELIFMYSFEYVFGKRTNKYKSIRIL